MNKKEFLKALENELIYHKVEDISGIVEYWDELIEDKKESGEKEKDIIADLSISDIMRNVKVHKTIEEASQKPSISNGMKALIAFLGILSFPMLIAAGGLLFGLFMALIAIIFALIVTFGGLFIAAIIIIPTLIGLVISGNIQLVSALFGIGIMLILVGIFGMLVKWAFLGSTKLMEWFINLINNKFRKKVTNNE